MTFSWNQFKVWEKSTKDTIDVKKMYIDIAEDVMSGILLSQIVYWYLPDKEGRSKLRVRKDGHFWIAKTRSEWYDEIRFTEANYKTAIKKLINKKIVIKDLFKFDGSPTTHIRLNIPMFLLKINEYMDNQENLLDDENVDFDQYINEQMSLDPLCGMDSVESTESKRSNQPNEIGEINHIDPVESIDSLTKSTKENTKESTKENLNLNPSILDHLQKIDIPDRLKIRIKILIIDHSLKISIKQLNEIENAYLHQKRIGNVISNASINNVDALNDAEFSDTIESMLSKVKTIDNMKGLIKKWTLTAISMKIDDYNERRLVSGDPSESELTSTPIETPEPSNEDQERKKAEIEAMLEKLGTKDKKYN